jgi:pimeloyl-ACP methyl ester carboxylesterase
MDLRHVAIHGHRLAYRTAGQGPVVLLVHGMASDSWTWNLVMPALAERFTVVAPDLLGHGASDKPRGEYSLSAHANVLRDLLDVLRHTRATVVGQSLGGGIAMQLAYQFPELCERLVLVSSGGLGSEVSLLLRALSAPGAEQVLSLVCTPRLCAAGDRVGTWLHRLGLRASPAFEQGYRSWASLAEPDTRVAFIRTLRGVVDFAGQAVSAGDRLYLTSHFPTLIIWGTRDRVIPVRHARAAHAAIPHSRLEIFENVGHYPQCDAPERFGGVLADFIASTEPAHVQSWREVLHAPAARRQRAGPGVGS